MTLNWEKFLVITIKYLSALVFFIPTIILKYALFPHTFGKQIILIVLIEVIFLLYCLLVFTNRTYLPKLNWLNCLFFLFILILIYTTVTSVDISRSFWGSMSWTNGLVLFLHLFLFFIVLISLFKTKNDWLLIFKSNLIAGALVILYSLAQLLDLSFVIAADHLRLTATLGNPIFFSVYQIFLIFICAIVFFWDKNIYWKIASVALFIPTLYLLIFNNGTRGALVGLLFSIIAIIFFSLLANKSKSIRLIALIILLLFIITGALTSYFLIKNGTVYEIFSRSNTVKTRLISWVNAYEGFKDRPITGWGLEAYHAPFEKFFNPEFYQQNETTNSLEYAVEFPHNKILELAVLNGIFSVIIYLAIFLYLFYLAYADYFNGRLKVNIILIGLLVCYFVQNLFVFDCLVAHLLFFTILAFANYWFFTSQENKEPVQMPLIKINWLSNLLTIILIILTLYGSYFFAIRPAMASHAAGAARSLVFAGQYEQAQILLDESQRYRADIVNERIATEMAKGTLSTFSKFSKVEKVQAQFLIQIINLMEKNINKHPYMLLNYTLLGQLYNLAGNFSPEFYESGVMLSKIAIEDLQSKRIETYRNLSSSYLGQNKPEEALKSMQQAIDLNPDYGYPYALMASLYKQLDDVEKEQEYLKQAIKYNYWSDVNTERLKTIYINQQDYTALIELSNSVIQKFPKEVEYYFTLADSYLELKEYDYAKAMLDQIKNYFPEQIKRVNNYDL